MATRALEVFKDITLDNRRLSVGRPNGYVNDDGSMVTIANSNNYGIAAPSPPTAASPGGPIIPPPPGPPPSHFGGAQAQPGNPAPPPPPMDGQPPLPPPHGFMDASSSFQQPPPPPPPPMMEDQFDPSQNGMMGGAPEGIPPPPPMDPMMAADMAGLMDGPMDPNAFQPMPDPQQPMDMNGQMMDPGMMPPTGFGDHDPNAMQQQFDMQNGFYNPMTSGIPTPQQMLNRNNMNPNPMSFCDPMMQMQPMQCPPDQQFDMNPGQPMAIAGSYNSI